MSTEEYTYKGFTIKIEQDECCDNPLELDEWIKLIQFHRSYGTDHDFKDAAAVYAYAKKTGAYILDLYLYDHSGTAYALTPFTCPWDSGQVGFFLFEKEAVDSWTKQMGRKTLCQKVRNHMWDRAKASVEEYTNWANGQCFGYMIEDASGEDIDSCWGFLGDDYVKKNAEEAVDNFIESNPRQLELPGLEVVV